MASLWLAVAMAGAQAPVLGIVDAEAPDSGGAKTRPPISQPSEGDQAPAVAGEPTASAEPPPPLWVELYSEGTHSSHENDNTSGFLDVKLGKRFGQTLPFDVYLKARAFRDQADFFWNNLAQAGAGFRVTLTKPVTLSFFAQATTGNYFRTGSETQGMQGLQTRIDRERAALNRVQADYQSLGTQVFTEKFTIMDTATTRAEINKLWNSLDTALTNRYQGGLAALDGKIDSLESAKDSLRAAMDSLALIPAGTQTEYQAGLIFQYGWGAPVNDASGPLFAFPWRFWGDVYSDCIYQAQRRHVQTRHGGDAYSDSLVSLDNLIVYANPDVGILLMDGRAGSAAAYVTAYAWFDTHRDWWNNLAMAGPGVRWQPWPALDFLVTAEYLWGRYYGRARAEEPLPYARAFSDVRIGANFWYGVGL